MDNKEILDKARSEKRHDERYISLSCKANKIAVVVMAFFVVAFVVVTAITKNQPAIFALLSVLSAYFTAFYTCRFAFLGKSYGNLIGGILCGIACIAMMVLFILAVA